MYYSQLNKKINRRKLLLNFLLKFLSPTNIIMVKLSKNLDKFISESQKRIFSCYENDQFLISYSKIIA
ncbi:MAG: hypothetical protein E7213_06770 [Clostridium sp.]|nr:hypothetical protein [Clostridium sp.]